MAKFTPGPWSTRASAVNRSYYIYIEDAHDLVAEVCGRDRDINEANAQLIAAAPELLTALKEVVALSDRKHNAWDNAHAAIAKAEGRQ